MRRVGRGDKYVFLTLRAQAPEGDFGFVYEETVGIARFKAGSGANYARNINNSSARAAHEMMVVIVAGELVQGNRTVWFDLAQELLFRQHVEDIVDGLRGYGAEAGGDALTHGVSGGVWTGLKLFEHR